MYLDLSIVVSMGVIMAVLLIVAVRSLITLYRLKKNPQKEMTTDATRLLSELTKRRACVVVDVLDPDDFFMLSPKDR